MRKAYATAAVKRAMDARRCAACRRHSHRGAAAFMERRSAEASPRRVRCARHARKQPRLCEAGRAHCGLRHRWHAVGRTAAVFSVRFRNRSDPDAAAVHPEWRTTQPFKAAIEGDAGAPAKSGERGLRAILAASHAGMTTDELEQDGVTAKNAKNTKMNWVDTAISYSSDCAVMRSMRSLRLLFFQIG